jgi:hypothetical protein
MYSRKLVEYGRLSSWFMCSLFHLGFLALILLSFLPLDIKMLNYHMQVLRTASCRWKISWNPETRSKAFKVAAPLFLCIICTYYKHCRGATEVTVCVYRSLLMWNNFDDMRSEWNLLHNAELPFRNLQMFADQNILCNINMYCTTK